MANEKRVRNNNVQGTLSSTMNSTGTTMASAGLANLEAISSTEHAAIVIDPGRTAGAPEIVHVTAHTGSATSATVARGREGTAARAHSSTEEWVHAPTATIDYLPFRPPSARARRAAAQSMDNNVWEAVAFDTEDWDTNTIWSSTAANKFFAKTPGKYLCTFAAGVVDSSGGSFKGVAVVKNSTNLTSTNDAYETLTETTAIGDDWALNASGMFALTTSDYITGQILQNSGAGLNTSTILRWQPKLSMIWLSS